jgi:hypothetical protein
VEKFITDHNETKGYKMDIGNSKKKGYQLDSVDYYYSPVRTDEV